MLTYFFLKLHLIFEQQFCSTVVEQVKKFGIPLLTWISVWKITSRKVDREQSKAHNTESREFCTFGAPHNIFRLTATPAVWPIPFEHQLPCYLRSPFYVLVEGLVANLQTQFSVLRVLLDSLCSHLNNNKYGWTAMTERMSMSMRHEPRAASGERSNNSFFNARLSLVGKHRSKAGALIHWWAPGRGMTSSIPYAWLLAYHWPAIALKCHTWPRETN